MQATELLAETRSSLPRSLHRCKTRCLFVCSLFGSPQGSDPKTLQITAVVRLQNSISRTQLPLTNPPRDSIMEFKVFCCCFSRSCASKNQVPAGICSPPQTSAQLIQINLKQNLGQQWDKRKKTFQNCWYCYPKPYKRSCYTAN